MLLNELIDWIKENSRLVIIGVCALLILSAAVGAIIGVGKRKSAEDLTSVSMEEKTLLSPSIWEKEGVQLLLPEPYTPRPERKFLEYTSYIEVHKDDLEKIHLLPIKLSDILQFRLPGEPVDIKPFRFNDEELDIVTTSNELAEP